MPHSSRKVRVGLFEIDLQVSEISRQGRQITVQDQPFRLLAMLLDRPGEVVTREEIQARLWPADTFVSFDDGLNTAVRKLRVLFKDSADNPRFIETVPRRGYRFIAPVTEIVEDPKDLNATGNMPSEMNGSAVSAGGVNRTPPLESGRGRAVVVAETATETKFPRVDSGLTPGEKSTSTSAGPNLPQVAVRAGSIVLSKSGLRIAAGVALIVTLSAVVIRFRPLLPVPRITGSTQLTNDGRAKATMVTDGARVYFSYSGFGLPLYQVSTAGGDTVPFPTTIPDPLVIDISPDHSKLLIWSCAGSFDKECPIWIVPALGGTPRPVGAIRSSLVSVDRDGRGRSPDAAWSLDGKELIYVSNDTLYRTNIDGSGSREIFRSAHGESIYWPRWSPDERKVRFSLQTSSSTTAIWEVSSDGKNPHPLLFGWNSSPSECCGSWTPDGRYFVFQSKKGGAANIWAIREETSLIRRATRQPVQLTTGPASTYAPLPSPDGRTIFVLTTQARGELMRYDSGARQVAPYFLGISATGLNFSADRKKITYAAYPEGTLWRSNADGSEKLQLTFPPLYVVQPRWSPDGHRIAFMGQEPGKPWSIYVVSAAGGDADQPVPSSDACVDPGWIDGNTLLFGHSPTDELPGVAAIYLETVDLRTHIISRVTGSQNLWSPRKSPDGRYILALAQHGQKLMLLDLNNRKQKQLTEVGAGYPEWSRNGAYIYFVSIPPPDQPRALVRIRINDGKLEQLMSLKDFRPAPGWGDWLGLDPDDSPLLLRDAGTQDIYALGWDAP